MLDNILNLSIGMIAGPTLLAATLVGATFCFIRIRNDLNAVSMIIGMQKCEITFLKLLVLTSKIETLLALHENLLFLEIDDERIITLTQDIRALFQEIKEVSNLAATIVPEMTKKLKQQNSLSKEDYKKLNDLKLETLEEKLQTLTDEARALQREIAEEPSEEVVSEIQPKSGSNLLNSLSSIKTGAAVLFGFKKNATDQAEKSRMSQDEKECRKRRRVVVG